MLSVSCSLRVLVILGLLLGVTTFQVVVRGQDLVGGANRTDLSGGAGGGGGTRTPRRPKVRNTSTTTNVRRVEKPPKTIIVKQTTRTLSVATEPGAAILVEPINGGEALEAQMEKDERVFVFPDVKPGRYRVAADLDGYRERDVEVEVLRNKPASVTLTLQPITDDVSIVANIPSGEVRYASVISRRDARGEVKYDPVGQVSVVPLLNGRATLPNLRPGTYGVDVRADDVGYEVFLGRFTLPGKTTYEVELTRNLSLGTFNESWASLATWETPPGWRVASNKLITSGRGVALPRVETVRHYKDFRLYLNINMVNGIAASFVVRAEDMRNYYLIQITGAKADEPYVLRGFVIKNGDQSRFGSTQSASGFIATLKQNKPFRIMTVATGNRFVVNITDSQTGEVFPLGTLDDPNGTFKIGAAGIAVQDNEQNEIDYFLICTDTSPDCARG